MRSYRFPIIAITLLLAPLAACTPDAGGPKGEWPQFRGPAGLGISTDLDLPTTWGPESDNILWKAKIPGDATSSPIVADGRVYVATAQKAGDTLRHSLLALDEDSGEVVWKAVIANRPDIRLLNRFGAHAGPTPLTDGEHIYAYFGADVAAVTPDGEIVWNREIEPDYSETTRYGAAASPVLVGDVLILFQDQEWVDAKGDVGWLIGLDRKTGEELWRVEFGQGACCSYVTPLVLEREGGPEVIVGLSQRIASFDPETGEMLWEDYQDMNQPVASPVADGDLLCVASGAHNVRETVCRRLTGSGKETEIEVLWRTQKAVNETSSPVLQDGILYMVVQKGLLTAYDAETGKAEWRQRLPTGAYHSSIVAGGGKIYVTNFNGVTIVLAAGDDYEHIATNGLGGRGSVATPAIANGRIYLRTNTHLVAIGKQVAGAVEAGTEAG